MKDAGSRPQFKPRWCAGSQRFGSEPCNDCGNKQQTRISSAGLGRARKKKGVRNLRKSVAGRRFAGVEGEPTDQMKQTTDKILSILSDPTLKDFVKTEEREGLIRKTLDE